MFLLFLILNRSTFQLKWINTIILITLKRNRMPPLYNMIKNYWEIIVLSLLILVGMFLRFFHLDYNSLWLDEACTFNIASLSLSGIWNFSATSDPNPPLFYLIEHFMLAFGQNEFVLRFIPALFGILTIPIFYSIGKEFHDKSVGITMAALLTFSPFHIFYSQEARAYSIMLFFSQLPFFSSFTHSELIRTIHGPYLVSFLPWHSGHTTTP